jgi:predicted  nucleic acid-binding Zn-ribbon protein
MNDQLKTVEKAAADSKGTKDEKARLDGESESLKKQVDEANKELDESKKVCDGIDSDLAKVVDDSAAKITKLTKAIETAKET